MIATLPEHQRKISTVGALAIALQLRSETTERETVCCCSSHKKGLNCQKLTRRVNDEPEARDPKSREQGLVLEEGAASSLHTS